MKYWRNMLIPIPVSLFICAILWVIKSHWVAVSFLSGAIVCWIGEYIFAFLVIRKIQQKRPQSFLWVFYGAEFLKLSLFAGLFVVAIMKIGVLLAPALMGFIANLVFFMLIPLTLG